MNDFTLFRQYDDNDKIGLTFYPLGDLDGIDVEPIEPEWVNGSYYTAQAGTLTANADMKYAVVDVSEYNGVIVGMSSKVNTNAYSGMREEVGVGNMAYSSVLRCSGVVQYSLMPVDGTNNILQVSQAIDIPTPILGLKFSI